MKMTKKVLSVFLSLLMLLSCMMAAMPTIAEAALSGNSTNKLKQLINAAKTDGELRSFEAGDITYFQLENKNYSYDRQIVDTSVHGYIYLIAKYAVQVIRDNNLVQTGKDDTYSYPSKVVERLMSSSYLNMANDNDLKYTLNEIFYTPNQIATYNTDNHGYNVGNNDEIDSWTVEIARTGDQIIMGYIERTNDALNNVPSEANSMLTISTPGAAKQRSFLAHWLTMKGTYTATESDPSPTNIEMLTTFFNYFSMARLREDPYTKYGTYNEMLSVVDNNTVNYENIYGKGAVRPSDTVLDYYIKKFQTANGITSPNYIRLIDTYMAACEDALAYQMVRPYVVWLNENIIPLRESDIIADIDNTYLTLEEATKLYETGKAYVEAINESFPTRSSKGYDSLVDIAGYDELKTDLKLMILEEYYDLLRLMDLKQRSDALRDQYEPDDAYKELGIEEFAVLYTEIKAAHDALIDNSEFSDYIKRLVYPDGYQYMIDFYDKLAVERYAAVRDAEWTFTFDYAEYFTPRMDPAYLPAKTIAQLEEELQALDEKLSQYDADYNTFRSKLSREDLERIFDGYRDTILQYRENIYAQMAKNLFNRVLVTMDYSGGRGDKDCLNLANFSLIRGAALRVRDYKMSDGTTVYAYLQATRPALLVGTITLTANGRVMNFHDTTSGSNTIKGAHSLALDLVDICSAWIGDLSASDFNSGHIYNPSTGYFADAVRYPMADDFGRGFAAKKANGDWSEADTYRVTNTKVEQLITQLDTFLKSGDFVGILSSLMQGDSQLLNVTLDKYVMKMVGDMLFTDDILNKLLGAVYPMITGMLEGLTADGGDVVSSNHTKAVTTSPVTIWVDKIREIHELAPLLKMALYPDQLYSKISASFPEIRAKLNGHESWDDVLTEDEFTDAKKFEGSWGLSAVSLATYDGDYEAWFKAKANRFKTGLAGILSGIEPLLKAIFTGENFEVKMVGNRSDSGWVAEVTAKLPVVGNVSAKGHIEDLKIAGYNGYANIIIPLLQDIGIGANYITAPATAKANGNYDNTKGLIDLIIDPIVNWVTGTVTQAPVATVLNILPNIIYGVTFDRINALVGQIETNVHGDIHANFGGVGSMLNGIGFYDIGKIEMLKSIKISELIDISTLITNFDLTDINSILDYLVGMILPNMRGLNLPLVNVKNVLTYATLQSGATYKTGTSRVNFIPDKADLLYDILDWVGKALKDDIFVDTIMNTLLGDMLNNNKMIAGIVNSLFDNLRKNNTGLFIAAIVELFQPKAGSGRSYNYNNSYKTVDYTWWEPNVKTITTTDSDGNQQQTVVTSTYRQDAYNTSDNTPLKVADYLYLYYGNDWTYDRASTLVDNLDLILTKLLQNTIQRRRDEDGKPLYQTFGQWLQSLIDLAFSNEALTAVARLLSTLGNTLNSNMLKYIISRFTKEGMDLSVWYAYYGYLFEDESSLISLETGEQKIPATKPEDSGYLMHTVWNSDGTTGTAKYTTLDRLKAAENPDFVPITSNAGIVANRNQKYIWTFDGVQIEDGNRAQFQKALGYLLEPFLPAINVFLSGAAGDLFPQSNGTSLLTVVGTQGYDSALIPLFEALGISSSSKIYKADGTTAVTFLNQSQFDALGSVQNKVDYLFDLGFGYIQSLYADDAKQSIADGDGLAAYHAHDNLIKNILTDVIPSLLYFIQSNGLSVLARNLLQPLFIMVDDLRPILNVNPRFIGDLLADLLPESLGLSFEKGDYNPLNIDIKDLSFHAIADLLSAIINGELIAEHQANLKKNAAYADKTAEDIYNAALAAAKADDDWFEVTPLAEAMDIICSVDNVVSDSLSKKSTVNGVARKRLTLVNLTITDDFEYLSEAAYAQLTTEEKATYNQNLYNHQRAIVQMNKNDPANTVTVLLSFIIDLITYGNNAKALGNFIAKIIKTQDGGLNLGDLLQNIAAALRQEGVSDAYKVSPDWFYLFEAFKAYAPDIDDPTYTGDYLAFIKMKYAGYEDIASLMPLRTIHYLRYADGLGVTDNLWTKQLSTYLDKSLEVIANLLISSFTNYSSFKSLVNNLWNGNTIFTKRTVLSIAKLVRENVAPAIEQFSELLDVLLDIDVNKWSEEIYPDPEKMTKADLDAVSVPMDKEEFVNELVAVLSPLDDARPVQTTVTDPETGETTTTYVRSGGILSWLLAGDAMAFFHSYKKDSSGNVQDLIRIPGSNGYKDALVPLLQAFTFNPTPNMPATATGVDMLAEALYSVLDRFEELVDPAEGTTTLNEILNILPNVIYYINANGLYSFITSLLAPIAPLVTAVAPILLDSNDPALTSEQADAKFAAVLNSLVKGLFPQQDENGVNITVPVTDADGNEIKNSDGTVKMRTLSKLEDLDISKLTLVNVLELVKALTGIDVNGSVILKDVPDLVTGTTIAEYNYLENFYIGELVAVQDPNNPAKKIYRMRFTDAATTSVDADGNPVIKYSYESRMDLVTILIYTVFDVLTNTDNDEAFIKLFGNTGKKDADGNNIINEEQGRQKLDALRDLLHSTKATYKGYNWFYFKDELDLRNDGVDFTKEPTRSAYEDFVAQLTSSNAFAVIPDDTTMKYLLNTYLNYETELGEDNFWNKARAEKIRDNLKTIINMAVQGLMPDAADKSADEVLSELWNQGTLYTDKYIDMIGKALSGVGDLVGEYEELIGAIIPDLDLHAWDDYKDVDTSKDYTPYNEGSLEANQKKFVENLVGLFKPFGKVLNWLLVGEGKEALKLFFLNDKDEDGQYQNALEIGGVNGFKEGLVPLIEALGVRFSAADAEKITNNDLTGIEAVEMTINAVLNKVGAIMNAKDDPTTDEDEGPVGQIINLLPNIIYFINANGVSVAVQNALGSIMHLIDDVSIITGATEVPADRLADVVETTPAADATDDENAEETGTGNIINDLINRLLKVNGNYKIDIYDLSLTGICNIVRAITKGKLDIISAVSIPKYNDDGSVQRDANGDVIYERSFLEQFAIGEVVPYDSAKGEKLYMMQYSSNDRALDQLDMFTILLCAALDVFTYPGNEVFWNDLFKAELWADIVDLLQSTVDESKLNKFEWFYFDPAIENEDDFKTATGVTAKVVNGETVYTVPATFEKTKFGQLLQYNNNWNPETASYIEGSFYNIIDTVISTVMKDQGYKTANEFIKDKWSGLNLYTWENLNKIGGMIGGIIGNIANPTIETILNVVLDIDVSVWDKYTDPAKQQNDTDNPLGGENATLAQKRAAFINELVDMFAPAKMLLDWLLCGKDKPLAFLYSVRSEFAGKEAIRIEGANGYDNALVPLFEALGVELDSNYFADNGIEKDGINIVKYLAVQTLALIDDIVNDGDPVKYVVRLVPELLYFINANGLSVTVRNLLLPVSNLIAGVTGLISTLGVGGEALSGIGNVTDLNGLVSYALGLVAKGNSALAGLQGLRIDQLDLVSILEIVTDITGIRINEPLTYDGVNIFAHFAIGEVVSYTSAAVLTRYEELDGKMVESPDEFGNTTYSPTYYKMQLSRALLRDESGNPVKDENGNYTYVGDENTLSYTDAFSVLVTAIVTVLKYKGNESFFKKLLTPEVYYVILDILSLPENTDFTSFDWLFTDDADTDTVFTPLNRTYQGGNNEGPSYDQYWTRDMADYISNNLVKVINNILKLLGIGSPISLDGLANVGDLVKGLIGDNLYTPDNISMIYNLIAGLLKQISEQAGDDLVNMLSEVLKRALGIDITKYLGDTMPAEFTFTKTGNQAADEAAFIEVIVQMLSPAAPLVKWLFAEGHIAFFNDLEGRDLVRLPGGMGYKYAIIPLLEAIVGYDNPDVPIMSYTDYKNAADADPSNAIRNLVDVLLKTVNWLLEDIPNNVLSRLPAILYFINSKGLDTTVKNLLRPIYSLLKALNPLLKNMYPQDKRANEVDLFFDLLPIDITLSEIDFDWIFEKIIGMLLNNSGADIPIDNVDLIIKDAVSEFTMGKLISYESKSEIPEMYTMVYASNSESSSGGFTLDFSNATSADMITVILRFVLKWISADPNKEIVIGLVNRFIESDDTAKYVRAAVRTLSDYEKEEDAISKSMRILYYLFVFADVGSDTALKGQDKVNASWKQAVTMIGRSEGDYMKTFAAILGTVIAMDDSGKVVNEDGIATGGVVPAAQNSMNFFQKIAAWFKSIINAIKKLFKR